MKLQHFCMPVLLSILALGSTHGLLVSAAPGDSVFENTAVDAYGQLHDLERRDVSTCLETLYIMAFTSGYAHSGSHTSHAVEIRASDQVKHLTLHDRPGNDMLSHKGDLWKINIADFRFSDSCITIKEIQNVYIVEGGNDGWNIESIVTFVRDAHGGVQVLTQDLDVFQWIDGNGDHTHRRFQLTRA